MPHPLASSSHPAPSPHPVVFLLWQGFSSLHQLLVRMNRKAVDLTGDHTQIVVTWLCCSHQAFPIPSYTAGHNAHFEIPHHTLWNYITWWLSLKILSGDDGVMERTLSQAHLQTQAGAGGVQGIFSIFFTGCFLYQILIFAFSFLNLDVCSSLSHLQSFNAI